MAYQTIRDLTTRVRSMHRELKEAVRDARQAEGDERAGLLLDFIEEHENALEQVIENAQQSGHEAILSTWLQFEPSAEVERAMKQRKVSSSGSAGGEAVALVLETENALIRLYQLLQGSHSSPSVQAFFSGLLEMEDSAARKSARVALESLDL